MPRSRIRDSMTAPASFAPPCRVALAGGTPVVLPVRVGFRLFLRASDNVRQCDGLLRCRVASGETKRALQTARNRGDRLPARAASGRKPPAFLPIAGTIPRPGQTSRSSCSMAAKAFHGATSLLFSSRPRWRVRIFARETSRISGHLAAGPVAFRHEFLIRTVDPSGQIVSRNFHKSFSLNSLRSTPPDDGDHEGGGAGVQESKFRTGAGAIRFNVTHSRRSSKGRSKLEDV